MVTIAENLKDGDIVYAWLSPFNEKAKSGKKTLEHEYRFSRPTKDAIRLASIEGGCWSFYTKELLESWNGNIRKA